ncbi:hypothetical protein CK934_14840 [Chitinophaga sp. MD30]|nr:hypothetical protein CK934_14840 [Chitinophaga sp. MD30]
MAACILLLSSCLKEKKDMDDFRPDVSIRSQSSIRLFNFYIASPLNVMVNNVPLTSFGSQGGTPIGLSLFPKGAWSTSENGSPFVIPMSLLDKNGRARVQLKTAFKDLLDTVLEHSYSKPIDFYVTSDGALRILPRQNTPPASPDHFRLRIIHLGQANDPFGLGRPMTLTYADGSLVHNALTGIAAGTNSEYIEIPYGAYQFKLFSGGGTSPDFEKQLAEYPMVPLYDGCAPGVIQPQQGISPKLRTFKPGGVYCIIVTDAYQGYWDCSRFNPVSFRLNSYRVVTEYDPGVNYSYARMHAVNALPGKSIHVKVDGTELGSELPYVGSQFTGKPILADYRIFVQGEHHVEASDDKGRVLAAATIKLYPYDNHTIWVHEKPDGTTGLLFAANDMTGSIYMDEYLPNPDNSRPGPDDGTNGLGRLATIPYVSQSRFLNLSPDLPYATFMGDHNMLPNHQPETSIYGATVNLASGLLPEKNPYILYLGVKFASFSATNFFYPVVPGARLVPDQIRVYRSSLSPVGVPGELLPQVVPLQVRRAYTANPRMYLENTAPIMENGVYSVALVGRTYRAGTQQEKARIIIIKHNN